MSARSLFASAAFALTLAATSALAQIAPIEPGGRSADGFYNLGVPGNERNAPAPGFEVDLSGRLSRDAAPSGFLDNASPNCHSHETGVAGVPFHSDVQCHDHTPDTPGVVPAR